MSRCFPFPPPGYEQKATDSVEVIAKEKHKSKKDKKEKRERGNKEGREKKHRDKNKEKHGEKKDRKDRDRDKGKKDKDKKRDKDRKKDRGGTSNEKVLEMHAATAGDRRIESGNANDCKFREELQSRIRDEKGAGRDQMVEPAFGKVQGSGMLFEKTMGIDHEMAQGPIGRKKRIDSGSMGVREQKFVGNHIVPGPATGSVNTEHKNRIGHSSSFAEKQPITQERNQLGSSSLCLQKSSSTEQRNRFGPSGLFPEKDVIPEHRSRSSSSGASTEKDGITEQRNRAVPSRVFPEKDGIAEQRNCIMSSGLFAEKDGIAEEKNHIVSSGYFPDKDASSEQRNRPFPSGVVFAEKGTTSGQRIQLGSCGFLEEKDANTERRDQARSSGVSLEKDAKRKLDGKEKIGVQGTSPQKIEKHKNKEKKKNKDGKERHKDKEKKKEKDKTREKDEQRDKEQKHMQETAKREEHQPSVKPVLPLKETVTNASFVGANLKRKEINGFFHENEVQPVKLQRTTPSPHPQMENGRSLENNHVSMPQGLERPVGVTEPHVSVKVEAVNDRKMGVLESEEHKANGACQHQTTASTSSKLLMADPSSTVSGEVTKKPPHPDAKFLGQILSVPKIAEWPEVDDQEWLFGHGDDTQQKPRTRAESEDTSRVWANTLKFEGADFVALPYVIPY